MYGVLFTQSLENDRYGVLLFKKKAKAKLAYRVMCGLDELDSLDPRLETILDSTDIEEVPEIDKIEEEVLHIKVKGKQRLVQVVNNGPQDVIPDIV